MILTNLSKSEEFARGVASGLAPLPIPAEHTPAPIPDTDNKKK